MKHPFSMDINKSGRPVELNAEETEAVSGGVIDKRGMATTMAVGEEGGAGPIRPPIFTTLAVGEEGGSGGILL